MSEKEHKTLEKIKAELTKILLGSNLYIFTDFDKENKVVVKIKGGVDNGSIVAIDFNKISNFNSIKSIIFEDIDFKFNSTDLRILFAMFSREYQGDSVKDIFNLISNIINIDIEIGFNSCKFSNGFSDEFREYSNTKEVVFKYTHFVNTIHFFKCVFEDSLIFENIEFANLIIRDCDVKSSVSFKKTVFKKFPYFNFLYSDLKFSFEGVTFENDFYFNESGLGNIKSVFFLDTIFLGAFLPKKDMDNLEKILEFECKLDMYNVIFKKQAVFSNILFKGKLKLIRLEFESGVVFFNDFFKNNYQNKIYFNSFVFHNDFDFSHIVDFDKFEICILNSNFKKSLVFPKSKTITNKFLISTTTFDDRLEFVDYQFFNVLEFKDCIFNKDLSFKQSRLITNFDFIDNQVKGNFDLSSSEIYALINIETSVFEKQVILHKVYFENISLLHSLKFSDIATVDISSLNIANSSFEDIKKAFDDYKDRDKIFNIKNIRECLNSFKDSYLKKNNLMEAIEYKIKELYAKEVELDYKLKNKENKEEKITIKERFDRWFLKLNRTTSDHHTDFLQIFLSTISVIGVYFVINLNLSLFSRIYEIKNFNILFFISAVVVLIVSLFLMYKKIIKFDMWFILTFLFIGAISYFFIGFYYEWLLSLGLPIIFIGVLVILLKVFSEKLKISYMLFAIFGVVGIVSSPSIITPFLGAFSEDARNHYLYKAIDKLDDKKALELARIILPNDKDLKEFEPSKTILSKNAKLEQISIFDKTDLSVNFIYEQSNQDKNEQSIYKAKKTLKDYKDELKSSDLLDKAPELKRAIAIDGGVSRLNIAYYLVLAFCIFALQKTMRKNSIIPS